MVKVIHTFALNGITGIPVVVETDRFSSAEPLVSLIGLPDTAVKEALDRVRAAARSSQLTLKTGKVTINLAPADVRKEGSSFDLPILISLADEEKSGFLDTDGKAFAGELSLTGELRPINGALSMALAARKAGFKAIYLPEENAPEASAAEGIDVFPVKNVSQLLKALRNEETIEKTVFSFDAFERRASVCALDYCDVKGQDTAKKALEIAAAGSHNVLMIGPPGSGKSMLASRIPSILPPISLPESIETTQIHSVAGILSPDCSLVSARPFRSPHHNMSAAGMAGGGKSPKPGEISLAHNGVLFLDEFPEFDKSVTEVLRQPLEERRIHITRVSGTVDYPASFILVCAMNPCKCGWYGHPTHPCTCTDSARRNYVSKISGPLLDRIDIQVEVPSLDYSGVSATTPSEPSAAMRERVCAAREFASQRFGDPAMANALMTPAQIRKYCVLDDGGSSLLKRAFETLSLSARSYDRILKVARTVADFDKSELIKKNHIALALQLRTLDKKYFG